MKPKILSWNVRGLNERDKRLRIRSLLRDWKVDIVCLQETKLEFVSRAVCAVYGVVNMWIGVIWGREGLSERFC
jgi:exonuclease III